MGDAIRWSVTVPGRGGVFTEVDAAAGHAYVGDGWAASYPATRLRRFDLLSGMPGPTARPKDDVMSMLSDAPDLGVLVATAHRVILLDRDDLTTRRQWRSPRYAATRMLLWQHRVVLANWLAPSIAIFDLATGDSRRVLVGQFPQIVLTPRGLVLGSGHTGILRLLRTPEGRSERLVRVPEFRSLAYDAARDLLGLALGRTASSRPPARTLATPRSASCPTTCGAAYRRRTGLSRVSWI